VLVQHENRSVCSFLIIMMIERVKWSKYRCYIPTLNNWKNKKKNKKMICEELQNFEQNKSEKFAENGQGAV